MFIRVFLNYFVLNIKCNEKLLGKLQEFFEFGRHFVVYHAGADLFSALIFDVIACFLAVFDSAKYSFCMAIQRECELFIVLNPFYLENKLYIGIYRS